VIVADPDLAGPLVFEVAGFTLAPLESADAGDLLAHFADPYVTAYMDIDPLTALDEAEAIIAWAHSRRALGAGLRWAIRHGGAGAGSAGNGAGGGGGRCAAAGVFVGTCGFNALVVERGRRGEIAYDLSRAWWGRGVMDAMIPFLAEFAAERLDLRRLEALVNPDNLPSRRVLERHGFIEEGLLRDYGHWKGRFQDQALYARLLGD
jgi:ribosomal-protein-alanine N-acetyltransferase